MMRSMLSVVVLLCFAAACSADGGNLICNGSFEGGRARMGAPDDWTTSGNPSIRQQLTVDAGRDGGHGARLDCTVFDGDGPDFHAMICQVGKVGVRRGQRYKLTLWAKAVGLKAGAVDVALVNTRDWVGSGLEGTFTPGPRWERFEFLLPCQHDVPAATGRLQVWFKSTGTLWLDDLTLAETSDKPRWYPQIGTEGVTNAIPNSSFECGTAGWGSLTSGLGGWEGNLFRLEGECDAKHAKHGRQSLRIALDAATAPVCWFDYYQPVRQPVQRVLAANRGWLTVKPGEPLTLSAYLRAEADGTVAQLAVCEAPERLQQRQVRVGTDWKRHEFTFTPSEPFLFVAVGLDLAATKRDRGVLWVDAVQLERGAKATGYQPRTPVESYVDSDVPSHVVNVQEGASLNLRACNDGDAERVVTGRLDVTDAFARSVTSLTPALPVAAHASASLTFKNVAWGRLGAFRARWKPEPGSGFVEPDPETKDGVATLTTTRLAVVEPMPELSPWQAPFGFNHAYPWDFLVESARREGVLWWRDWSTKWDTVESQRGTFDWRIPDAQIGRVAKLGGHVDILLPFASAAWSSSARPEAVAKTAGRDTYLRSRLPMAYAPKNLHDFGRYAAATVRHYDQFTTSSSRRHTFLPFTVQVLNEPVYTDYALPQQFGYTVDDYLKLLEVAHDAMKQVDPHVQVVGGISAGLTSAYTREFITKGGLKGCDVVDLHIYDAARAAETYEEPFRAFEELMKAHGPRRPVWITEWGCYADDDPPSLPLSIGDASMNRCRWPSERAATEHIVKFAAIGRAHGVEKILFHAGTAGRINGPDAGGVLFEYAGAPRTMYAGIAAFTKMFRTVSSPLRVVDRDGLHGYVFSTEDNPIDVRNLPHPVVAVAWSSSEMAKRMTIDPAARAFDLMGNLIGTRTIELTETPVYLVADELEVVLRTLGERQ